MKASAIARANIALVKYWGKRDSRLILPMNGSISMTAQDFSTRTTVEVGGRGEDSLIVNGESVRKGTPAYDEYVGSFLGAVREFSGNSERVKIASENDFPTAAGLASSASGFAALATALNKAMGLGLDKRQLSMLARRGSGSAARSIHGGFVEWIRGDREDGTDSFARQLAHREHWPEFRMVACITSDAEKKVKSRSGMSRTVSTSPMYSAWLDTVEKDLALVRQAILDRDFSTVGRVSEANCLKMHATMMTTDPPLVYWNPVTLRLIHSVQEWRAGGLECFFTIDAGPQVKILCPEKDLRELKKKLEELGGVESVRISPPGEGSQVTGNHLF